MLTIVGNPYHDFYCLVRNYVTSERARALELLLLAGEINQKN